MKKISFFDRLNAILVECDLTIRPSHTGNLFRPGLIENPDLGVSGAAAGEPVDTQFSPVLAWCARAVIRHGTLDLDQRAASETEKCLRIPIPWRCWQADPWEGAGSSDHRTSAGLDGGIIQFRELTGWIAPRRAGFP